MLSPGPQGNSQQPDERKYMEKQIEFIARGFIFQNEKILLCKRKDRDYYFFPGGHVEFGEFTADALKREIKEEVDIDTLSSNFIGTSENIFKDNYENGKIHHEMNLVFETKVEDKNIKVMEDYLEFKWLDMEEFLKEKVQPTSLKEAIIKWIEDKNTFWISQNDLK
jgi:8-oxo-dGTP diphosphatase